MPVCAFGATKRSTDILIERKTTVVMDDDEIQVNCEPGSGETYFRLTVSGPGFPAPSTSRLPPCQDR